jgi:hypothetical protein
MGRRRSGAPNRSNATPAPSGPTSVTLSRLLAALTLFLTRLPLRRLPTARV